MPILTLSTSLGTMALSGTLFAGQVETLAVVIAASEAALPLILAETTLGEEPGL